MSRKEDLEEYIRAAYNLIHEYEEMLRLSDNPRERAAAQRAIEDQQTLLKKYQEEYQRLMIFLRQQHDTT